MYLCAYICTQTYIHTLDIHTLAALGRSVLPGSVLEERMFGKDAETSPELFPVFKSSFRGLELLDALEAQPLSAYAPSVSPATSNESWSSSSSSDMEQTITTAATYV